MSGTSQKPSFDIVLPDGSEDKISNGKVAYDPEKKVVSFTDTIGTIEITVSQQELPQSFKNNPEGELKKLAEGFGAKVVLNAPNLTGYLGTSAKGPQTVILQKNNLLIFAYSNKKIDEESWTDYIRRLL